MDIFLLLFASRRQSLRGSAEMIANEVALSGTVTRQRCGGVLKYLCSTARTVVRKTAAESTSWESVPRSRYVRGEYVERGRVNATVSLPMKEPLFNTSGPVLPTDHYCVPSLDRCDLNKILRLIRAKRYFVLHAPGQMGKTSALPPRGTERS